MWWWWGPGSWWPGVAVMVGFMVLCGVLMSRMMSGRGGIGGMCGMWLRRRIDDDVKRVDDPQDARHDAIIGGRER